MADIFGLLPRQDAWNARQLRQVVLDLVQVDVKHLATPFFIDSGTETAGIPADPATCGQLASSSVCHAGDSTIYTAPLLLLSVILLAVAVVISWMGDVLMVLLQVWAVQNTAGDWSSGWTLVAIQAGVFPLEVLLVGVSLHELLPISMVCQSTVPRKPDKVARFLQIESSCGR
ncbi:MAG: hypothetical protein R3C53_27090 [Pirellulaceae bacterium]